MPDLSLDWFLFLLRLTFIVLLYLFLYQLARVTLRDLIARGEAPVAAGNAGAARRSAERGRLVLVEPGATGLVPGTAFALLATSVVGRHPDSTITLDDPSVSAEHAEVSWQRSRWWVRDSGSTNGTLVNGARVDGPTELRPDDIVQFGRVACRLGT